VVKSRNTRKNNGDKENGTDTGIKPDDEVKK
jgi:hypothetical protein